MIPSQVTRPALDLRVMNDDYVAAGREDVAVGRDFGGGGGFAEAGDVRIKLVYSL